LIEHQIDHVLRRFESGRLLSWVERLPRELRDGSFKVSKEHIGRCFYKKHPGPGAKGVIDIPVELFVFIKK
jgi:hypothetical protein